jgi:hypothetical protein
LADPSNLLYFLDELAFPEGQIFLVNLLLGLEQKLICPAKLNNFFQNLGPDITKDTSHEDVLGSIAGLLTHKSSPVLLQNPRNVCLEEFTNDAALYFVCERSAFETHYADMDSLVSNHDFDQFISSKNVGKQFKTRPTAKTKPWFWATSVNYLNGNEKLGEASRTNAARMRDILGLIQHKSAHLFAIEVRPSVSPKVYRPTVIEAVPNARFLQAPKADRDNKDWGWTADMEQIKASTEQLRDLFGLPELVVEGLDFESCTVEAFYLGELPGALNTVACDSNESHLEFLRLLRTGLKVDHGTALQIETFLKNHT